MKLILLLALALVGGPDGANSDPCHQVRKKGAHVDFRIKHILWQTVPTNDKEWNT